MDNTGDEIKPDEAQMALHASIFAGPEQLISPYTLWIAYLNILGPKIHSLMSIGGPKVARLSHPLSVDATCLPFAVQFIFGDAHRRFDQPAEIAYLFGEYYMKTYALGSYSFITPPVQISLETRKKRNRDEYTTKIRIQFYFMSQNPQGEDQFYWLEDGV
eukprot:TRINITY_DN1004_c0_g1_i4.p1 TRINITY_DN1004_c0_g1~~TRINITY_DN1004_c0_g1_i4.p1  ORF type:complete len:160 (+),score=10.57 TRINITY_DN1004_c0_g1_i4:167-646(+)